MKMSIYCGNLEQVWYDIIYIYICIYMYMYKCTCIYTLMYVQLYIQVYEYVSTHMFIGASTNTKCLYGVLVTIYTYLQLNASASNKFDNMKYLYAYICVHIYLYNQIMHTNVVVQLNTISFACESSQSTSTVWSDTFDLTYMYICICIHTLLYAYTHIHICKHMHVYIYIYTYTIYSCLGTTYCIWSVIQSQPAIAISFDSFQRNVAKET